MERPSQPAGPYLAGPSSSVLMPGLELHDRDGLRVPLWNYRWRGPLVVLLYDEPSCTVCAAYLGDLACVQPHYREIGAQILAVGRSPVAGLPYPCLVDPCQRLVHALAARGVVPEGAASAVLVVGRTGAIWAAWGGDHVALPGVADLEGWIEYALSECRECFCCELAWPWP
jgi:peroxiredoxin